MSEIVTTILPPAERPVLRSPADPRRAPLRLRSSGRRSESVPSSDPGRRLLDLPGCPQPKAGIGEPLSERFSPDLLGQGALTASEVMSPAFLLLVLIAAASGLINSGNTAVGVAIGGALLASGVLTWLTLTDRPSRWRSTLCLARDATATLVVISLFALAYISNPFGQAALMTAPVILMAAIIAASMPGQRWPALRHLPVYLLTDRLISFVLYGYALANVHNVTWGTKGLTDDAADQEVEKQRMRRLRNVVAGAIVAINVTLIALGLWRHGAWITGESSVVEVFTLLFLAVAALAAAVWIVSAWRSLPALFRWRSPESRFLAQRVEILRATQEA